MGRYSSVQAYADSNSNMRSVSYEQATGSSEVKKGTVKTEKVSNPYGSTAGAGSGEFHVYRHARSREMERWNRLEEQEKQEKLDREFHGKLEQAEEECKARTDKNRKKRQRQKEAKMRKKNLQLSGVAAAVVASQDQAEEKKDDEFTYTPTADAEAVEPEEDSKLPAILENDEGPFLASKEENNSNSIGLAEGGSKDDDNDEPPAKRQAS